MSRRGSEGGRAARVRGALAAVAALVLVATGCSASAGPADASDEIRGVPDPSPAGEAEPAPGEEPAPEEEAVLPPLPAEFTKQELQWAPCSAPTPAQGGGSQPGDDWQCATLTVPVDYAEPEGATLELAVIGSPHQGGKRIGSLVFNFGGPGGSGVASLPRLAGTFERLHAGFDLISVDPRGVGESEGVVCRSDTERDAALAAERFPSTAAEQRRYLEGRHAYAADCRAAAGELLPRLTTANTARDLDVLRRVLGDSKLHYYGASYGTKLGAVYANLFPDRVGRMVLDSVVDPTADVVQRSLGQAGGFQLALDNYLERCTAGPGCPAGGSVAEGHRVINELLDSLAERPLPASGGRQLTQALAVTGIIGSLYSEGSWDRLTLGLREALESGDGTRLLAAADRYNGRSQQGTYRNLHDANTAINCADFASRPDLRTVRASLPDFTEAAPVLGRFLVWELLACAGWPAVSERDQPTVVAEGSRKILLVATTGDPATPYRGAERMRDALGEGVGVLLTYDGEGHGAYTGGDSCVTDAVDGHLLSAATPADDTVCG